jgi:two-component system, chemotaxis family, chemotaxis protein CheY
MKCLIVDDEEFNRDYVTALLDSETECDHAGNGRDAVEMFTGALQSNAPYDLILLDIMMPDMDGHEAARSIRSIEKERGLHGEKRVNVVMLTALNSPQDAMESFCTAQSAAYLVKPVSKEKLSGIISKLGLNRKR